MARGRPKQAREIAELKGADRKNPQRYRDEVPKHSGPLGPAPENFSPDYKAIWDEFSETLLPGVNSAAERMIFEITVSLMASFRKNPEKFSSAKLSMLSKNMEMLGLNPSARQKFAKPKEAQPQDFDDFE